MATYRNLRRQAEDVAKKYARYNEVMTNYAKQIEGYNAAGDEYNAFINSIKAGQQYGIGEYAPGTYTMLKGYSDSNGQPGLTPLYSDKRGNAQLAGPLVDKLPDDQSAIGGLNGVYLKNSDGTATFHQYMPATSGTNENWANDPANWTYDDMGNRTGIKPDPSATPGGWTANPNYTARVANFNTPVPTEPDVEPPKLNLTNSQQREMANPTADAAAAIVGTAKGYGMKTSEANAGPSANSALAGLDPEDQFKDKGILARVLGGEI